MGRRSSLRRGMLLARLQPTEKTTIGRNRSIQAQMRPEQAIRAAVSAVGTAGSMATDEIGDATKPALGMKDPLNALINQDLLKRMGPAIAWAREKSEAPSWPIWLCVAWALCPIISEPVVLYARHRVGLGVRVVDRWREVQKTLLRALVNGRIGATGVSPAKGERVPMPSLAWIDLQIVRRRQFDDVRRLDGSTPLSQSRS
jgi:hypothetical protein